MENNILNNLNTIFVQFFNSIDTNIFKFLDDLIFVKPDILKGEGISKILREFF